MSKSDKKNTVTMKIQKELKLDNRRAVWSLKITGDKEWAEKIVEDFKTKHGFEVVNK